MDRTKELAARARSLVQQWSPCRLGGAADGGLLAEGALARCAWDATHTGQATIEEAAGALGCAAPGSRFWVAVGNELARAAQTDADRALARTRMRSTRR